MVLLIAQLLAGESAFATDTAATPSVMAPKVKVTMRNHGYTIGDLIAMHAEFSLKKGQKFDVNSVPLKGPVNNWLDLRDTTMIKSENADGSQHIAVDFTWQMFGTVDHAQLIKIPAIAMQTLPPEASHDKPQIITVPAQRFYMSPVLPPTLEDSKPRPHMPPLRFDTYTPLTLTIICLSLALLMGLFYLWLCDKIAWWPRNPGPITRLARQFKYQKIAQQARFSKDDLRNIHAALAASAGQSLYPNTLDKLFEKSPYLAINQAEIIKFFNTSWRVFHEKNATSIVSAIFVPEVIAWVNRAAIAERLARSQVRKSAGKGATLQLNKSAKI